jgi:hypothetical protein
VKRDRETSSQATTKGKSFMKRRGEEPREKYRKMLSRERTELLLVLATILGMALGNQTNCQQLIHGELASLVSEFV